MATFKALNIESDDELDDEPDNTKEIQIEEALKVYQTALKYHSQGSRTLKEAGEAYGTLFESEIFNYPESLSDYRREELLGIQLETDGALIEESVLVAPASAGNAENAPSTLPQIIHLSYKNRGQYHLDALQSQVSKDKDGSESIGSREASPSAVTVGASRALNDFAEALDKDEDDTDLWRRAAKVSSALGSRRISRFCFEAVLDEEEDGLDDIIGGPGIEASLARHDLKKLEGHIQDDLSIMQATKANSLGNVPSMWREQMGLYKFLPDTPANAVATIKDALQQPNRIPLDIIESTWNGIGQAILQRLRAEQAGTIFLECGAALELRLPTVLPKDEMLSDPSLPHPLETLASDPLESVEMPGSVVALPEHPLMRQDEEVLNMTNKGDTIPTIHAANGTSGDTLPERTDPDHSQGLVAVDQHPIVATLPTRKRSIEAAELAEQGDGGRIRSKRLRARTSIAEDGIQVEGKGAETVSDYEWKISESVYADNPLFEILGGLANKSGIGRRLDSAQRLRNIVKPNESSMVGQEQHNVALNQAIIDFYETVQNWSDVKALILLRSRSADDAATDTQKTGLLAFLEHTKASSATGTVEEFQADLPQFVNKVNKGWYNTHELALFWVVTMFAPLPSGKLRRWPHALKQIVVQMVVAADEYLSERVRQNDHGDNTHETLMEATVFWGKQIDLVEIVQGLFELHLDIYARIINPASEVDLPTRLLQKARLCSWCEIARSYVQDHISSGQSDVGQEQRDVLALRHLWTSVFHLGVSDSIERDHFVLCIEDLKRETALRSNPLIHLPNNAVLPELSLVAADREISKLKTMDFFLGIFQKEGKAPVDIIEKLEPLLEHSTSRPLQEDASDNLHCENSSLISMSEAEANMPTVSVSRGTTQQVLAQFLKGANVSLRLLLWRRLREAYEGIDYPPKVLSICLRSIELLMNELKTPEYTHKKKEEREILLLDWLGECSDLIVKALALTNGSQNALECIDIDHLRSSIGAVLDLWSLLYSVALFDDYSQAGQKGGSLMNPFRFYPIEGFHAASVMFHDMQVKTCLLLYKLFQEAMSQMPQSFVNPVEDRLQYLRHMHFFFGVRRLCKASDSSFLQFTKDELLSLPELSRQSSDDLAQVLYDLYDLHCFSTPLERLEHGCDTDYLDRKTSLQVMDFVMDKVQRMSIKDLLKSDLGKSVEKLHTALGPVKSNTFAAGRNRKLLHVYLRSPLRPIDLFQCLGGIGDLSAVTMNSEDALIASKGWFFLKGDMALAKHRAQRAKGSQGSEDDLHIAIAFFMQDLEYSVDRWETWYRLAQSHDALLEEQVLWSAEKVNSQQDELVQHQRAAIHAYVMAVAGATRTENASQGMLSIMGELYHDFGTLVYSSTRQPFSMRAFSTRDFPAKYYSDSNVPEGKYTGRVFRSLKTLHAWKLASLLLRRAKLHKPHNWITHYMLAKCLWKIHQNSEARGSNGRPVTIVQEALFETIEALPARKDTNRQEPILEPIYKVVTIAHKLVQRGELSENEGSGMIQFCLQRQKQFEVSKTPNLTDFENWTSYMIDVLRLLRAADKSRWHHRLVFRAARIMYTKSAPGEGARRAKEYLIEQHMYSTKTLALTVWKPEYERSGRHWSYMKRYALFLAQLLEETDDLEGMETLTRRIRKKTNEYYEHTSLWEELCILHLKLHRRHGNIPENLADVVFKNVDQEEFAARAALIDAWTSSPKTSHRLQDVLRETAELKKLNAGLMKSTAIDDLLGDAYAAIWTDIGPTLESQKKTHVPNPSAPPASGSTMSPPSQHQDKRSVMSLTNLMNLDGALDSRPTPPLNTIQVPAATTTLLTLDSMPKPRARLISRREMLKRASDTVTAKVIPPSAPTPPPKTLPQPSSVVRVVIEARQASNGTSSSAVKEEDDDVRQGVGDSVGSSLHDDADDESELSELEEEEEEEEAAVVRPMLFPNLKSGSQQAATAHFAQVPGEDNVNDGTGEDGSDVNME